MVFVCPSSLLQYLLFVLLHTCLLYTSLTGTHFVGQQRIAAVQHMSNGILLVFPQPDFRIHARCV